MRTYSTEQRTLLNALWSPKWKEIHPRGDTCKGMAHSIFCTVETNTKL